VKQNPEEAFSMIKQRLLPFKIGLSREVITPRSGLAIYSEFLRSSGIEEAKVCRTISIEELVIYCMGSEDKSGGDVV